MATREYALHSLVRHFARERLEQDAEPHRLACARHATHAAHVLRDLRVAPTAGTPKALSMDGAEIADIRAAWVWAVSQHPWEVLEQLLDGLVARFVHQGWLLAEAKRAREASWVASLAEGRSAAEAFGLALVGDAP